MYYTTNQATSLLPAGANLLTDLSQLTDPIVSLPQGQGVYSVGDPPQTFSIAGKTYVNVTTDYGRSGWVDQAALISALAPSTKLAGLVVATLAILWFTVRRH